MLGRTQSWLECACCDFSVLGVLLFFGDIQYDLRWCCAAKLGTTTFVRGLIKSCYSVSSRITTAVLGLVLVLYARAHKEGYPAHLPSLPLSEAQKNSFFKIFFSLLCFLAWWFVSWLCPCGWLTAHSCVNKEAWQASQHCKSKGCGGMSNCNLGCLGM